MEFEMKIKKIADIVIAAIIIIINFYFNSILNSSNKFKKVNHLRDFVCFVGLWEVFKINFRFRPSKLSVFIFQTHFRWLQLFRLTGNEKDGLFTLHSP